MQKNIRTLLSLQGIFWFVLAALYNHSQENLTILVLLIFDGIGFLLFALFYSWRRLIRFGALFYLLLNFLLTIADQMGFLDYLVLGLNTVTILLVMNDLRGRSILPKRKE